MGLGFRVTRAFVELGVPCLGILPYPERRDSEAKEAACF